MTLRVRWTWSLLSGSGMHRPALQEGSAYHDSGDVERRDGAGITIEPHQIGAGADADRAPRRTRLSGQCPFHGEDLLGCPSAGGVPVRGATGDRDRDAVERRTG